MSLARCRDTEPVMIICYTANSAVKRCRDAVQGCGPHCSVCVIGVVGSTRTVYGLLAGRAREVSGYGTHATCLDAKTFIGCSGIQMYGASVEATLHHGTNTGVVKVYTHQY